MSLRHHLEGSRDERGAVSVLVALTLPVLVMLLAWFVIDLGAWFEHQRHLQLQADAGVLAGAQEFAASCNTSTDTTIKNVALQYAGLTNSGSTLTPYNPQVASTQASNIAPVFNQDTYANGQSAVPTDKTAYSTNPANSPCTDGMIDLKLQETQLPWYFWAAGVPAIDAHARASLFPPGPQGSVAPIGVPEENPTYGEVYYFDESTGQQIAPGAPLTEEKTAAGAPILDSYGHPIWDDSTYLDTSNPSTPVPGVPVDLNSHAAIGVRIALSSIQSPKPDNLSGTWSTDCSTTTPVPFVSCYDPGTSTSPSNQGLLHIRAWSNSPSSSVPTTKAPAVRDVQLLPDPLGPCQKGTDPTTSDAYFTNDPTNTTCYDAIAADVNFGQKPQPPQATVTSSISSGKNNATYNLKYLGTGADFFNGGSKASGACAALTLSDPNDQCWVGSSTVGGGTQSQPIPVAPTAGAQQVDLQIGDQALGSTTLTFANVQRAYSAYGDGSGPVLTATSYTTASSGADVNSLECDTTATSCNVHLFARFTLLPSFQVAQSTTDPTALLRVAGNGAQTQTLNCWQPTSPNDYKTQFQLGCPETYIQNTGIGGPCSASTPSTPAQNTAFPPYQCAYAGTGQTPTGMVVAYNNRFEPTSSVTNPCPNPNNYAAFFKLSAAQQAASTDPRKIYVLLTPLGSFTTNGNVNHFYPVLDVAEFYVTYWQGGIKPDGTASPNSADPCGFNPASGDGSYTSTDPYYNGQLQEGDLLGHFVQNLQINPTNPPPNPPPSVPCSLASLDGCAIYLTQ